MGIIPTGPIGSIPRPLDQHYHVSVNADIHAIETMFVAEDDKIVNPLGVKGMGEVGQVGIPAAIANARKSSAPP